MVTVGVLSDGFYVSDGGLGIAKEDRGQVFNAGYTTSADGTGFGLAIVSEIVETHNRDISVTDTDVSDARFKIDRTASVAIQER